MAEVKAPPAQPDVLYLNFIDEAGVKGSGTGNNFVLQPGDIYEWRTGPLITLTVTANSMTRGHRFSCTKW
jgi:hypothetical protein